MKKYLLVAIFGLFLTACSSKPVSYLPEGSDPIVNIEAPLAEKVDVSAKPLALELHNRTEQAQAMQYKLFWYDKNGVTQSFEENDRSPWLNIWLEPLAKMAIPLTKPTPESANYRAYLRGGRSSD